MLLMVICSDYCMFSCFCFFYTGNAPCDYYVKNMIELKSAYSTAGWSLLWSVGRFADGFRVDTQG